MIKYIKYNDTNSIFDTEQVVKVYFSDNTTKPYFTVYRSFEIDDPKLIKAALENIHKDPLYQELKLKRGYNRTLSSEIREWKAHNILYKLHIRENQTKDTDFSKDESKLRKFGYFFLSAFYWLLG